MGTVDGMTVMVEMPDAPFWYEVAAFIFAWIRFRVVVLRSQA